MKLVPVSSSVLASVGYDPRKRWLVTEFKKTGRIYRYLDVPADLHTALMDAASKGGFYNAYIRDDFRFVRLK
ncbi:MAG: KTSC domain-containing protein [Proteobacteria bacterium]|nr:KTSC domain-containing protein [Pseudomonadota bacterium]